MAADYFNKLQTGGYDWDNNVAKRRQEQSRLDALVGGAEQAGVAEAKNREQQSRVDSAYQKGLGAFRVLGQPSSSAVKQLLNPVNGDATPANPEPIPDFSNTEEPRTC